MNYGFQSGGFNSDNLDSAVDTSNSFASALHFDPDKRLAYITGATYWSYWDRIKHTDKEAMNLAELNESDCFLAVLKAPQQGQGKDTDMDLLYTRRFGKSSVDETCSSLSVVPSNGKVRVVTAGHTYAGGLLTTLRSLGSPLSKVYGFLLSLDLNINSGSSVSGRIEGASLSNNHAVQYPIAVTANPNPTDSGDNGAVYTVSLTSAFHTKNGIDDGSLETRPDNTAAGGIDDPVYGNHYSAFIQKLVPKTQAELDFELTEAQLYGKNAEEAGLRDTLRAEWTELLSPTIFLDNFSRDHQLHISDLKYVPRIVGSKRDDLLVLTGSTSGYGDAFGADSDEDIDLDDDDIILFKKGFVTTFDTNGVVKASTTIAVEDEADVIVRGFCFDQIGEKDSIRSIYVVGETMGLLDESYDKYLSKDKDGAISKHAFLVKLDADTLDLVWARQMGGFSGKDVIAYGCAVSPKDEVVYMAGTVAGGDKIKVETGSTESSGGDDIFVASYSSSGERRFVNQAGSSKDDWLAKGNGIVTDKEGNAILLGNTKGSMMRWRGDQDESLTSIHGLSTDVFVLSVGKSNGNIKTVSEFLGKPKPKVESSSDQDDEVYQLLGTGTAVMVVGATFAMFMSLYVGYTVVMKKTIDERANGRAMQYLDDFHDPNYNLQIRDSAYGGIHAVYDDKEGDDFMNDENEENNQSPPDNGKSLGDLELGPTKYMSNPMDSTTYRRHGSGDDRRGNQSEPLRNVGNDPNATAPVTETKSQVQEGLSTKRLSKKKLKNVDLLSDSPTRKVRFDPSVKDISREVKSPIPKGLSTGPFFDDLSNDNSQPTGGIKFDLSVNNSTKGTKSQDQNGLSKGSFSKPNTNSMSSIDSDIADIMQESFHKKISRIKDVRPPSRAFSVTSNISFESSINDDDSAMSFENVVV